MNKFKNPMISFEDSNIKVKAKELPLNDYQSVEVYFAFIDVLGFKNNFEKKGEEYKELFNYYFSIINNSNMFNKSNREEKGICYAGQTSDSLYFYTKSLEVLEDFIYLFAHFNLYAMSRGVFFRGAISKGDLNIGEDYQFFGESIIKSYLMESNIAKNPVIVIDTATYKELENTKINDLIDIKNSKNYRWYLNPFAIEGVDVDIKRLFFNDGFEPKLYNLNDIEKHINDNMEKFEYDNNNYSKYVYLKNELLVGREQNGKSKD